MDEPSFSPMNDIEAVWLESPCGLVTLNARLHVVNANPAALRMLNRSAAEVSEIPFPDLTSPERAQDLKRAMVACLQNASKIVDLELTLLPADGGPPLEVDAEGQASANATRLHLCLSVADHRRARQRLVEDKLKDAELAASIVAASSDAILSFSSSGFILSWNRGAEQLYGYSEAEAIGQHYTVLGIGNQSIENNDHLEAVLSGKNIYFETERRHKDGAAVAVAIGGGPIFDPTGRVVGVAAVHRDIRAQTRHETQLRFVMRELAHRTKNLLAIIQSIERQTARGVTTTEEFHERFSSRLQALAASHDLLVEANWAGARIGDLIERQLAAFSDQIGGRILLSGPSLQLSPEVAQTLGLALHELATNATKYGALSIPSGRVAVTWGVFPDDSGDPRFRIEWRESDGPPVSPPRHRGFGSLAIERLAAQALNGKAELIYAPEGVFWTLSSDPSHVDFGGQIASRPNSSAPRHQP